MNERARRAIPGLLAALVASAALAPTTSHANTPPTISGTPPATVTAGSIYAFTPNVADADGDKLSFVLQEGPSWLTIDKATGRLSGKPTSANVGVYANLRLVVYDGTYYRSLPFFSITVKAASLTNGAPRISGAPAASVLAGTTYSFTPAASDPNGDALTFSIANKPAWATFDTRTGRLSGTPGTAHVGSYANVTISVSDGKAKASLAPFPIAVTKAVATNTPPTLAGTPPATVAAGATYAFTPTVTNADGDTLSFVLQDCPSWLAYDKATGRLFGTPTSAHVGVYGSLRLVVYDGTYYRSLPFFSITVTAPSATNGAPKIMGTPALSVLAGTAYTFAPTASDPDGDALTFSVANKPTWATFDATTGRLTGTPGAAAVGSYGNVTISVSDGKAKASLAPFAIAVNAIAMGATTLTWETPTTNADGTPLTKLAGFRVVYGRAPDQLTQSARIANPSLTRYVVENLSGGAWYFAVIAYNSAGAESDLSGIVRTTIAN